MQRLQPLVLCDGDVYAKTHQQSGVATLVTALGVEHPLRRLVSARTLLEHHQRSNRQAFCQLLQAECMRQNARACSDPLGYFLTYLLPAFLERDWYEDYLTVAPTSPAPPVDVTAEMAELAGHCPVPHIPFPALLVLGRVWKLAASPPVQENVYVRFGSTTMSLTGEFVPVGALERIWREEVQRFVTDMGRQVVQKENLQGDSMTLQRAHDELTRIGCLQYGDVLFIAGTPPRLGYVIPPHYNRSFGHQSQRDLAMTAPLALPPTIGGLGVYQRTAPGRWMPVSPPHGLCLGPNPEGSMADTPGLALAAYLRWAAWRVASNGRFHEHDT